MIKIVNFFLLPIMIYNKKFCLRSPKDRQVCACAANNTRTFRQILPVLGRVPWFSAAPPYVSCAQQSL